MSGYGAAFSKQILSDILGMKPWFGEITLLPDAGESILQHHIAATFPCK